MDTYLGHDIKYWSELESKAQELGAVKWLEEIADLRAKVSFYESRIKEMNSFKDSIDK